MRIIRCIAAAAVISGVMLRPDGLAGAAGVDDVEVEPIKCWWKSDATAVLVGERFRVTLTCGVVETESVRTVPNRDALEPAALTLTPFEVVSGTRHEDIVTPPWRYFQYEYVVRLLGDEFFGQDIDLPSIDVAYNLVSKSTETEAREHRLRLPPLPLRVLSIVPKKAADVRDRTQESFAAIQARRFRANGELVAAAVTSGFALLFFGLAMARMFGRFRRRQPAATRPLAPAAALGECVRILGRVRRDAQEGWNAELVARALAALRVAAAVAAGRTIAQVAVEPGTTPREGQIAVRTGLVRRRSLLVSGAARADGAFRRSASLRTGHPVGGPIDDAMRVFSQARYGRHDKIDGSGLEAALGEADRVMRRLRLRSLLTGRASLTQPARPREAM